MRMCMDCHRLLNDLIEQCEQSLDLINNTTVTFSITMSNTNYWAICGMWFPNNTSSGEYNANPLVLKQLTDSMYVSRTNKWMVLGY